MFPLEDSNILVSAFSEAKRGNSLEVLSKRIVIQAVLLFGRSEATAQVEEEMDSRGWAWFIFSVFVSRET